MILLSEAYLDRVNCTLLSEVVNFIKTNLVDYQKKVINLMSYMSYVRGRGVTKHFNDQKKYAKKYISECNNSFKNALDYLALLMRDIKFDLRSKIQS